nr:MAG: hypothetical protein [Bacteriophage sp.]
MEQIKRAVPYIHISYIFFLYKKKVYLHLFHLFRSLKATEKALKIKGFRAEQI